ncbi:hypothetical protein L2E82_20495 [Cichorium intybus]|uniref:Uncharacterized protein n=1 Tax=Cichorium intybus TaxID=13427 RepID=A0ACB9DUC0_CICIN|nr:hypothetical protein L2E82_20495 [Cichorium intybus]
MAKHHPDLIMCRKQPGIAIGRLCEKCDGKCVICDSYVRPCTLVRVCDECNYGSFQGRCVICGGVGISDAYYCKECTQQEKDRDGCPKIVNLGSAKTDLFYERKKYGLMSSGAECIHAFEKFTRLMFGRKELFKDTLKKAAYTWKLITDLRLSGNLYFEPVRWYQDEDTRFKKAKLHYSLPFHFLSISGEEAKWLRLYIDEPAFTDLHWGMYIPAIEGQGIEEQKQKWLLLAQEMQIIGCYAQTKLGHGSNVEGLETIATFDPQTDEFVLHSSTLNLSKVKKNTEDETHQHVDARSKAR